MSNQKKQWFKNMLDEFKDDPEFKIEGLMLEINEEICSFMEERNISRSELAEKLGTSRAYVTKILNGNPNLTLRSLVMIAHALDCDINIRLCEKDVLIPRLSGDIRSGKRKSSSKLQRVAGLK